MTTSGPSLVWLIHPHERRSCDDASFRGDRALASNPMVSAVVNAVSSLPLQHSPRETQIAVLASGTCDLAKRIAQNRFIVHHNRESAETGFPSSRQRPARHPHSFTESERWPRTFIMPATSISFSASSKPSARTIRLRASEGFARRMTVCS